MSRSGGRPPDSLVRIGMGVCLRFVLLAPLCLVGWLVLLPAYVWVAGWIAAQGLRLFWGEPITAVEVLPGGVLNTETALRYVVGDRALSMASVGHLMANVAPFVALVLATPATWRRRAGSISLGVPVLFVFHVVTIVLRFEAGRTTMPTVVGFVAVTLPFLLWIMLAFWDTLTKVLSGDSIAPGSIETRSPTQRH